MVLKSNKNIQSINFIYGALTVIILGTLFFGSYMYKLHVDKTKMYSAFTAWGIRCRGFAEYLQEYINLPDVNKGDKWEDGFAEYLIAKVKPVSKTPLDESLDIGIYLIGRKVDESDASVFLGYSDIFRVNKEGYCYLFFLRDNEVVTVRADEWQLRLIIGESAFGNRKAFFILQ